MAMNFTVIINTVNTVDNLNGNSTCTIDAKTALNVVDNTVTPSKSYANGIYLFGCNPGPELTNIVVVDVTGTYLPYGGFKNSFTAVHSSTSSQMMSNVFQMPDGSMSSITIIFAYDPSWVMITDDELNMYVIWLNSATSTFQQNIGLLKNTLLSAATNCTSTNQLLASLTASNGNLQTAIAAATAQQTSDNATLQAQKANYTAITNNVNTQIQTVATLTGVYNGYVQNANDCNTTMVSVNGQITLLSGSSASTSALATAANATMTSSLASVTSQINNLVADIFSTTEQSTLTGAINTLTVSQSLSGFNTALNTVFPFC